MTHLLCLGDSITDCGRIFDNPPLGLGYVQLLKEKFLELNKNISITNCGVDGFTVSRILANAKQQLYPLENSIVTLLIGINDIGMMMNTNRTEAQKSEMIDGFMHNYDNLLGVLCTKSTKVILMEPFIFPHPQEYNLWIPYVQTMSQIIQKLAIKYNIPYISLHNELNKAAIAKGISALTTDGIHLTEQGHQILADKLFPIILSYFS